MKALLMECFMYVALSRVGSPECLTMLVREEYKTRNVVYSEIFN